MRSKMGNHALERSSRPSKLAPKMGRQKVPTPEELKESLDSMKLVQLVPYLKSHHLLRNCSNYKAEELPKPWDLVWARNMGYVYWPAFICTMEDREDQGPYDPDEFDNSFTFVMFLEDTYRFAPIPWEQIIPLQDGEVQKILVSKLNRFVVKTSWRPSTMYKKSLKLIDEFSRIPPMERQKAAESRYMLERETAKAKAKKKVVLVSKEGTETPEKPPITQEINKVVSQSRNKKKSGLRVSDRIVRKQIGNLKESEKAAKKKTEKPVEEKTPPKPAKPTTNARRPDVGGEILKQWTKDRFDLIPKQYMFESTKPTVCSECDQVFVENEEIKTCHGLPHHERCLSAPAAESTALKCSKCIDQLCFLCRKPHETKVVLKCTRCDLRFHIDCLSFEWPQAEIQGSNGPITCPLHFCHTCFGEQKIFGKFRDYTTNPSRAYKCLLCLSTYHKTCLPAGCGEDIRGKEYIICPKHKIPDLKVQQRRVGCLGCCKVLKPKEEKVDCLYCVQAFHPACIGYTGDVCDTMPLEVFAKGYRCYSCRWGLFPLYGQVVWYQQPQSQYWPARILFPNEVKQRTARGAKRQPGQYSVEYFGTTCYYDNASRGIPLHLTTIDIFKSMKVYHDTPKIVRAHEEAWFFLQFGETLRDAILQKPKPIYKKIERNVYRTITAQKIKEPSDICSCSESDKADFVCVPDSGCTNRDMEMECSDRICKGGSRCSNRMFTERKNDDEFLEQKLFLKKGWGIVAKKEFNPGEFISEYRGEVIDRKEMCWRLSKKEEEDPMYIMEISKEFFIDAEYIGNLSRLINHSCDPNSEIRKYLSQGKSVGGIFAKRKIDVGEEVTFDYGCGSQSTAPFRCRCGADSCLVFVGKEVPDDFQAEEDNDVNVDKWDDVCSKCGYGGRVICCEFSGCGKVWHYQCIGLSRPPRANWCCPEHPVTTQFRKKKASSLSRRSRTKTTTNLKPKLTPKTENTPQVSTTPTPTVPKLESLKTAAPRPSYQYSPDITDLPRPALRKRKSTIDSNTDSSGKCSPSKRLKTLDTHTPLGKDLFLEFVIES